MTLSPRRDHVEPPPSHLRHVVVDVMLRLPSHSLERDAFARCQGGSVELKTRAPAGGDYLRVQAGRPIASNSA